MENPTIANSVTPSQTMGNHSFLPEADPEVQKLQAEVQELQDRIAKLEEQGRELVRLFDSLEGKEPRLPWWQRLLGPLR